MLNLMSVISRLLVFGPPDFFPIAPRNRAFASIAFCHIPFFPFPSPPSIKEMDFFSQRSEAFLFAIQLPSVRFFKLPKIDQ